MSSRMAPSTIKNKIKREELAHKFRKSKGQAKLAKRLAQAKIGKFHPNHCYCAIILLPEVSDPAAKAKRLAENISRTLDNTREYDPSSHLTVDVSQAEVDADLANDPFADFFSTEQPEGHKGILITTGPKACKATYEFCEELVGVFPGAEFIRRKRGKGFELGRIAGWAANRHYGALCVVNEDMKRPSMCSAVSMNWTGAHDQLRCHYFSASSEWTNSLLQIDIHRAYKANLRTRACNASPSRTCAK